MVTAILVLLGSTGCMTTEVQPKLEDSYTQVLLGMIPELPEVPDFPALSWSYSNGLYSISEEDVDKLLDYGENMIPRFRWDLEQYEKKLNVIVQVFSPNKD